MGTSLSRLRPEKGLMGRIGPVEEVVVQDSMESDVLCSVKYPFTEGVIGLARAA